MSGQSSLTSKEHADYWNKKKGPDLFGWIKDIFTKKQPALDQIDQRFSQAQQFAGDFTKDPRAAYRKYGSADINKLMDEAVSKGWLRESDRKTFWNLKQAEDYGAAREKNLLDSKSF
jgi:hypothetical protein